MAKILSPNKEYTGVSASVSFVNGQGETDNPVLIEWFESHGYEVVEDIEEPAVPEPEVKTEGDKTKQPEMKESEAKAESDASKKAGK